MDRPPVDQQRRHHRALVLHGLRHPLAGGRAPLGVGAGERGSARGGAVRVGGDTRGRQLSLDVGESGPVAVDLGAVAVVPEGDRGVDVGAEHGLPTTVAAQRQPREGVERQVGVLRERQGDRPPHDRVEDRRVHRDRLAGGHAPRQQVVDHGGRPARPAPQLLGRGRPADLLVHRDPRRWLAETVKSRGVITPWSLPPRSVTTRYSASRSSMRISASAADSPSATVGTAVVHHLAGGDARLPALHEHPAAQQRVGDQPEPAVLQRDDGVPGAAARHRGGDLADRVVGVDLQRVGLDDLVDEAVGGQATAAAGGGPLHGEEPRALPRGEGGLDRRLRDRRHGHRVDGHRPRPERALGEHGREAEDAAGPELLVGGLAEGVGVVPQVHAADQHDEDLDAHLREGVEDELARPEPADLRRPGHHGPVGEAQPVERRGFGQRRGRGPPRRGGPRPCPSRQAPLATVGGSGML